MTVKEKLHSIVDKIVIDIYRIEEALDLFKKIGEKAENINDKDFGKLFNAIQVCLVTQIVIRTTRIFETPKNNKLNSIPYVLKFLSNNKENIDIFERTEFINALKKLGMNVNGLMGLHYVELNKKCIDFFYEIIPEPKKSTVKKLWDSLYKTKWQKDKVWSHNEILGNKKNMAPTFSEIDDLINFAKKFVIGIGWGYTGTIYGHDFDWTLKDDTELSGLQMEELLKISKITL